jgi:predicted nucleotidyltransferase component of viral defense system
MDKSFYTHKLYPFQDQVLRILSAAETGFYLTGGTALSRGYLNHRFSDDLDFFVNDRREFVLWSDRIIQALRQTDQWQTQVLLREERYVRINLNTAGIDLKIECVNDVPSRVGEPWIHPVLGRLDTAENILANKITAVLDRSAPKDLADIWGLCLNMQLSLKDALTGAHGKAAGVFEADLARVLCSVTHTDWELVRWINPPNSDHYIQQLNQLGQDLILPN